MKDQAKVSSKEDANLSSFIEDLESLYPAPKLPDSLATFSRRTLYNSVQKTQAQSVDSLTQLRTSAKDYTYTKAANNTTRQKQKLSVLLFGSGRRRTLWVGLETVIVLVIGFGILLAVKAVPNPFQVAIEGNNGPCGNQPQPGTVLTNPVAEAKTNVNSSQTTNGITFSLKQVSADPARISISIGIAGNDGCKNYLPFKAVLTDDQGHNFSSLSGTGSSELVFDASIITNKPTQLKLHLAVESVYYYKSEGGMETILGPFNFDFTIPFDASQVRITQPNQTDTGGGVPLTLEKVVLSRSQTRIYLRGQVTNEINYELAVGDTHISNDSLSETKVGTSSITSSSDGWLVITLDISLFDKKGEWSLIIKPHRYNNEHFINGTPPTPIAGGPWVFRFEIPSQG